MLSLTGYTDRLSARPGESIEFRISVAEPGPVEAKLVRIVCADPNPAGPGRIEEERGDLFTHSFEGRPKASHPGSYAVVEAGGVTAEGPLAFEAVIWPTRPGQGEQIALSTVDANAGVAIGLDATGAAMILIARAGAEPVRVTTGEPLPERQWARIRGTLDPASGEVTIAQGPVSPPMGPVPSVIVRQTIAPGTVPLGMRWHIAALGAGVAGMVGLFNGKIEAPAIRQGAGPEDPLAAHPGAPLAAWDFSLGIPTLTAHDTGPNGLNGRLVNLPARAMRSSRWTGSEMCWRHAPEQYAAIHFHDTDLADCGWETDFTLTVPDLPSGVWGMRLTAGDAVDTIPFFVLPPKGTKTADVCVLMSTLTYVVYTNFDRPDFNEGYRQRATEIGMNEEFPGDHPEYGFSTYNTHSDGSGIC
ncbi:MAG: N,N-dimethylformamidase beta subunit family domain-containing protein, partial [Pseudomonadota bacterium]